MVDRVTSDKLVGRGARPDQRFALLGVLMAKESRLGDRLVVVGDSAITIYTNAECVSAGFDVGGEDTHHPGLRRCPF